MWYVESGRLHSTVSFGCLISCSLPDVLGLLPGLCDYGIAGPLPILAMWSRVLRPHLCYDLEQVLLFSGAMKWKGKRLTSHTSALRRLRPEPIPTARARTNPTAGCVPVPRQGGLSFKAYVVQPDPFVLAHLGCS